ncbi:uncharacterized protein [Physcomitrium patens]|uniref:uncharacterized protein isoform X2 n=1 Tax=Physcomitrium patens TaxID=3218 RepID=UPI003CCCFBFC
MNGEAPCEIATHGDRHRTGSIVHKPGRRKSKCTKTLQTQGQQQQRQQEQWQWASTQGARATVASPANSVCSGGSSRCKPLKLNGSMEDPAFTHPNDSKPDPPSLSRSKHSSAVIEDTSRGDELHKQENCPAQVVPGSSHLAMASEIAFQARPKAIGYVCGACQAGMMMREKKTSGAELGFFQGRHSRAQAQQNPSRVQKELEHLQVDRNEETRCLCRPLRHLKHHQEKTKMVWAEVQHHFLHHLTHTSIPHK